MKIVESSSDEEEEEKMTISSPGKQANLSSQPDTGTADCIVEENKHYPNGDQNIDYCAISFFNYLLSRIVLQHNFNYQRISSEILISVNFLTHPDSKLQEVLQKYLALDQTPALLNQPQNKLQNRLTRSQNRLRPSHNQKVRLRSQLWWIRRRRQEVQDLNDKSYTFFLYQKV